MTSVAISPDLHRYAESESPQPSVSSFIRPFKLLVRGRTFLIDSTRLSKVSPVFAVMLFGKDFDKGRELTREIVDEKSADIAEFLRCLDDANNITENNFTTVLRLATKYQVASLIDSCELFILNGLDFQCIKPDQLLTLILAASEYHLRRPVMELLVMRLAAEEKSTFDRLRLSRYLPSKLYAAVVGTNLNLALAHEIETMNAHFFKTESNRTYYRRAACELCKKITNAAYCEGCKKMLCVVHCKTNRCTNEYGLKMLAELQKNIVELEWD